MPRRPSLGSHPPTQRDSGCCHNAVPIVHTSAVAREVNTATHDTDGRGAAVSVAVVTSTSVTGASSAVLTVVATASNGGPILVSISYELSFAHLSRKKNKYAKC